MKFDLLFEFWKNRVQAKLMLSLYLCDVFSGPTHLSDTHFSDSPLLRQHFSDNSLLRQLTSPTTHFSDNSLLRQFTSPTTPFSDNSLLRQLTSPTTHFSDNPLLRQLTSAMLNALTFHFSDNIHSISCFVHLFLFSVNLLKDFVEMIQNPINWKIEMA